MCVRVLQDLLQIYDRFTTGLLYYRLTTPNLTAYYNNLYKINVSCGGCKNFNFTDNFPIDHVPVRGKFRGGRALFNAPSML